MNRYIKTLLAVVLLGFTVNAQTNTPSVTTNTVAVGKSAGQWELTLSGDGETLNGESYFGLDFSLGNNPFSCRPEIWLGLSQSVYWEPTFAGSTDLSVNWSQAILPSKLNDNIYLNVGWSVGALYTTVELSQWRTGPEATLQYYTSDSAFIFAGVNYNTWVNRGDAGGWRYSFGIGLSF